MEFLKADVNKYKIMNDNATRNISMLVTDIIDDSNYFKNKHNNAEYEISSLNSQLDDLALPVGLITTKESDYMQGGGVCLFKTKEGVIENDVFDLLFHSVSKIKTPKYNNNKTKKIKR
jgi:hypothetical protein